MLKILLVYDDFQELTSAELMLKKIGFDIVGITSEFSLAEQLLSFNPQIVVAQGRTAKVSTANVGRRLRESARWDGQSVLIFYPNAKPQPTELLKIRMDVGLEYPVEPTKMVQVLAQLGSLDSNQLLDKLIKSMAETAAIQANKENATFSSRSENSTVFVSGGTQNQEQNQKFGGAAGAEQRKALSGQTVDSEQMQNVLSGQLGEAERKKALAAGGVDAQVTQKVTGQVNENQTEKSLTASEAMEQLARGFGDNKNPNNEKQDVNGKVGGNANGPLFPLQSKNSGTDSSTLGGAGAGNDPNSNVKGTQFDLNPFQMENLTKDPLMQELESLLQKKPDFNVNPPIQDRDRHKKYEEYMKTIPIQHMASIKRKEAKLRLRDLIKDIDKPSLGDQDVLRREYVKALFKKPG
jgi:DNA-binding response OmpR family regulator